MMGRKRSVDSNFQHNRSYEMGMDSISAGCTKDKCAHYSEKDVKIRDQMQKLQGIDEDEKKNPDEEKKSM